MTHLIDPVAERALNHFGHGAQRAKAFEELGELVTALSRDHQGANYADVIDEIADVQIVLRQLRLIYGPELVDERVEFKLRRLLARMDGEEGGD